MENRRKSILQEMVQDCVVREKRFAAHHKVLFTLLIFCGVVLVWYGVWGIVSVTPFLKDPLCSLVAGVVVLVGTGTFFSKLG